MKSPFIAVVAALALGMGEALAQSSLTAGGAPDPIAKIPLLMKTVEEWQALPSFGGSSGSAKVQLVNVIGDPSKPGLYIQLEKVAPHVVIEAHHHAGDRTVTVIQGTLMYGNGPKFDRSELKVMSVGSIYTQPSGSPHFAATADQSAVTEVTGYGPTDIVYENPADDSSKKPGGK
jgi:quercetin dioxygenase-like cupin family protein